MKFFNIFLLFFTSLLLLPFAFRGLEKFYEQSFLIYNLSNSFKYKKGYTYCSCFSQKSMVMTKMQENLSLFLTNPEEFISTCSHRLIKKRGGQELYRLKADQEYVLKVFEQKGVFKNIFKENRAMSAISGANFLDEVGIKTIEPVAFVLKRSLTCSKGYYLSKVLRAKSSLKEFKKYRENTNLKDIANLFSSLHQSNLVHGDLTPMNILFEKQDTIVIDTSDVHYYPKYSLVYYLRHCREISFCFRHFDYE